MYEHQEYVIPSCAQTREWISIASVGECVILIFIITLHTFHSRSAVPRAHRQRNNKRAEQQQIKSLGARCSTNTPPEPAALPRPMEERVWNNVRGVGVWIRVCAAQRMRNCQPTTATITFGSGPALTPKYIAALDLHRMQKAAFNIAPNQIKNYKSRNIFLGGVIKRHKFHVNI